MTTVVGSPVLCLCWWFDVGSAGAVQNLRITHGADGQVQVQGLLPGCYLLVKIIICVKIKENHMILLLNEKQ